MPLLPVVIDDPINSVFEVLSIISHPFDDCIRKCYKYNYILRSYIEVCNDIAQIDQPPFSEYFHTIKLSSQSISETDNEASIFESALKINPSNIINDELKNKKIIATGYILLIYYAMLLSGKTYISLKKSVYVSSKLSGISEKTLWAYLKDCRDILHICCAFTIYSHSSNDKGITLDNLLAPNNINRFVCFSEQIRMFFEKKIDKRTGKTVLDPETTWKAPAEFAFENAEIQIPEALIKAFETILNGYSKRHLPE